MVNIAGAASVPANVVRKEAQTYNNNDTSTEPLLGARYTILHLILIMTLWDKTGIIFILYLKWGNQGTERLADLPEVAQVEGMATGLWTQAVWLQSLYS